MTIPITSTANQTVKQWKKLKNKKDRNLAGLYLAEGVNLVEEAIAYRKEQIDCIVATDAFLMQHQALLTDVTRVYAVTEQIFSALSDTKTPQGVLAVMRAAEVQDTPQGSFFLYLDHVADPGNVGTLIRTADAAGADAVILSPDCADLYNLKTVRATMGSLFHLPVLQENTPLARLSLLQKDEFSIVTGSLDAKTAYTDTDLSGKVVICVGNEAHGVTDELTALGVTKVKIPIFGHAESLNVSVAGGILLYEAVRQRRRT